MLERLEKMREAVEAMNTRSAWKRGVNAYALELLEELDEAIAGGYFAADDLNDGKKLSAQLLNGAKDWTQYSYGGCALIYNGDIAERLCTPSELKKTRSGEWRPNSREDWLDVQARALLQAARRVREAARKTA